MSPYAVATRNSFDVLQLTALEGGTYSARLMPTIASMLQQNRIDKTQLDGFAAVSGPGSFTGLRVGLATVKGLCEVLQKPLATVSMLEALAVTRGAREGKVAAILDAGRGEVYAGEYNVEPGRGTVSREYIVKLASLAAQTPQSNEDWLTPDISVSRLSARRGPKCQARPARAGG